MLSLNFNPFPVIETQRLVLRQFTMNDNDVKTLFSYRSNAEAMKYIGKPLHETLEDTRLMIKKITDNLDANEAISWAITLKGHNDVIGSISFHRIEKQHYRAELGYMLHPTYWRQGITGEAVDALIEFGFRHLGLHSIEAHINPENTASENTLRKFKFVKEAHFKECCCFNGVFSDRAVYSLLKPAL